MKYKDYYNDMCDDWYYKFRMTEQEVDGEIVYLHYLIGYNI